MRLFAVIGALCMVLTIILAPVNSVHAQSEDNLICNSLSGEDVGKCNACMQGKDNTKTWTAIGCIAADPNDLLGGIIKLGMGVAGGIAFLLILFGGLQIMTSAGNPEQLNAGRELVSSAIIGLILIIFSIFILRFIGVNIIGIPGWDAPTTSGGR